MNIIISYFSTCLLNDLANLPKAHISKIFMATHFFLKNILIHITSKTLVFVVSDLRIF